MAEASEELCLPKVKGVKLLCSYGGRISSTPNDGKLRYTGGQRRIIAVNRGVTYSELMARMLELHPQTVVLKYQLPGEDLDTLVSVCSDEDIENMIDEHDDREMGSRIKIFLFSSMEHEAGSIDSGFPKRSDSAGRDGMQDLYDLVGCVSGEERSYSSSEGTVHSPSAPPESLSEASLLEQISQYTVHSSSSRTQSSHVLCQRTTSFPLNGTISIKQAAPEDNLASAFSKERVSAADFVPLPLSSGLPKENLTSGYEHPSTLKGTEINSRGLLDELSQVISDHFAELRPFVADRSLEIPDLGNIDPSKFRTPNGHCEELPFEPSSAAKDSQFAASNCAGGCKVKESPNQTDLLTGSPLNWQSSSDLLNSLASDMVKTTQKTERQPISLAPLAGGFEFQTKYGRESSIQAQQEDNTGKHLWSPTALVDSNVQPAFRPQLSFNTANLLSDFGRPGDIQESVASAAYIRVPGDAAQQDKVKTPLALCSDENWQTETTGSIPQCDKAHDEQPDNHPCLESDELGLVRDVLQPKMHDLSRLEAKNSSPNDREMAQADCPKTTESGEDNERVQGVPVSKINAVNAEVMKDMIFEDPTCSSVNVKSKDAGGSGFSLTPSEAELEAIARGLQIIRNADLEERRELGAGTFGTVYYGKWRGSDVAIKRLKSSCFSASPGERERDKADFWKEACILAQLHHPNVVAFYGVVPDGPDGTLAMVTEFMINGSIKQVLRKKVDRILDPRRRLFVAMDAAFGMEYLHSKKIVHFDLKCENLFVNVRDPQRPICKVGDLGLSKMKERTFVSGGARGTLHWMAPELLNGSSNLVNEKVDVYSFGIVMWELLTGEEPYEDLHFGAILKGILEEDLRPPVPEGCDASWRSLMERCWSADPAARPTFAEVADTLRSMAMKMQRTINPPKEIPVPLE